MNFSTFLWLEKNSKEFAQLVPKAPVVQNIQNRGGEEMLSIKRNLLVVAILILSISIIGCGTKLVSPEGELDTPEYNYQIGKKFLKNDNK